MLTYLWISFGAMVGASLRYVVGRFVARAVSASYNLLCLAGVLAGAAIARSL